MERGGADAGAPDMPRQLHCGAGSAGLPRAHARMRMQKQLSAPAKLRCLQAMQQSTRVSAAGHGQATMAARACSQTKWCAGGRATRHRQPMSKLAESGTHLLPNVVVRPCQRPHLGRHPARRAWEIEREAVKAAQGSLHECNCRRQFGLPLKAAIPLRKHLEQRKLARHAHPPRPPCVALLEAAPTHHPSQFKLTHSCPPVIRQQEVGKPAAHSLVRNLWRLAHQGVAARRRPAAGRGRHKGRLGVRLCLGRCLSGLAGLQGKKEGTNTPWAWIEGGSSQLGMTPRGQQPAGYDAQRAPAGHRSPAVLTPQGPSP